MVCRRARDQYKPAEPLPGPPRGADYPGRRQAQSLRPLDRDRDGRPACPEAAGLFGSPDVVIGTIQTLQRGRLRRGPRRVRPDRRRRGPPRQGHDVPEPPRHFTNYWLLGITATPDRGDGQNLGAVFDSVAYEYKLKQAIEDGFLVPLVTARLHTTVDLKNIKTTGGDFNQGELEERIGPAHRGAGRRDRPRSAARRQTVVFTPTSGSEAMADALSQLGVKAEAVSGAMPKVERRDAAPALLRTRLPGDRVLRPADRGLGRAAGGVRRHLPADQEAEPLRPDDRRGTRPHPDSGKVDCLVIDFAWQTTVAARAVHRRRAVRRHGRRRRGHEARLPADARRAGDKLKDPKKVLDEAERIVAERAGSRSS
jgi:hypothetical protein